MERKGKLSGLFLSRHRISPLRGLDFILCLLYVCGCTAVGDDTRATVDIVLTGASLSLKSEVPEVAEIRDANIFIFSAGDFLEKSVFIKGDRYSTALVEGRSYDIYACANFGYPISIGSREELNALVFHLAHPEDFASGMPLGGVAENVEASKEVVIPMKRLCSKISIAIDRSRLDNDVKMTVSSLKIGNCPRKCTVFRPSAAEDSDGCFPVGFSRDYLECAGLNSIDEQGLSSEVSLYMLENLQGRFPGSPESDADKILPENHPAAAVCSYVEMGVEYESPHSYTSGGLLKYRFYLGDSFRDANVERNCHYHITVTPKGSGISENSWRVDKTALVTETSFSMEPEGYIEVEIGDVIHIRCSWSPEWAPFYAGDEELEEDRQRGIYEYAKDADGKGVKLTITGYGTGMVYMSAGEPVNRSGLLYLHVKGSEDDKDKLKNEGRREK